MGTKILIIAVIVIGGALIARAFILRDNQPPTDGISTNFHSFTLNALDGDSSIAMEDYKGKFILAVNVASKCGYTPQYEGLQELYEKHKDKLVIVGFPCNQFMGQEPGDAEEIRSFCKLNYGVTFPLTEKIDVKGADIHPLYQWLTNKSLNGQGDYKVSWNFNKFLISPDGKLLAHFGSKTKPMSDEITSLLK